MTRIRFRVQGFFRDELSSRQKFEIKHIDNGMRAHIPERAWREMSTENLAALYIWNIVEAGVLTFDALNLKGLDAWKLANDQIRQAALSGRRLETICGGAVSKAWWSRVEPA
jgi:hypothetical protein